MNKKIIIGSAIVIVAIVAIIIFTNGKKQTIVYREAPVEQGSISNTVTATGTVEPITKIEVGTQVSGKISKIYVDYNSTVKKGELIAELDQTTLETELQSSAAQMNSAKTEMEYQKINFDRINGLYKKDLVSKSEYETSKYTYDKAKYTYNQSTASYKRAIANIGYAKIYSPVDGVVLSRAVDEGQTVASGFSTPTLFTIAQDLSKMQVVADVDEADIGEVKEGQQVSFNVDAFPDETFHGSVTQVRLQSTTTSNVVTYEVVINAPNPDLKLKPGLTANVNIETLNLNNILIVPVRALRYTPSNFSNQSPAQSGIKENATDNKKTIWTKGNDGTLKKKEIVIGASDGINTRVISGVVKGELVITGEEIIKARSEEAKQQQENSNPFMPKRPNESNNKRTK
jgi:HlyD family secretion protein